MFLSGALVFSLTDPIIVTSTSFLSVKFRVSTKSPVKVGFIMKFLDSGVEINPSFLSCNESTAIIYEPGFNPK